MNHAEQRGHAGQRQDRRRGSDAAIDDTAECPAPDERGQNEAISEHIERLDRDVPGSCEISGPLSEGPYASQMQTSLSSAITGAGGLGLAQSLYKEMQG